MFVVYGEDLFLAIEVKNTANIRPADLKSLRSFHDDYPEAQRILLYRGKEQLKIDQIYCIPSDTFIKSIHPDSLLVGSRLKRKGH